MQLTFEFQTTPRIVFGDAAFYKLSKEAKILGATRALVVADPALEWWIGRAEEMLGRDGVETLVYHDLSPEPAPEMAEEAAKVATDKGCDLVVGLGGGSAMDTAKAASVLATNGGRVADYMGLDLVEKPGLKKIMIPSTAGTGAEVTFTAVFTDRPTKSKGGINSRHLFPDVAIVDAELTHSVPPYVTATTGLDALTHAVESFTSRQANPLTDLYGLEAIRLIVGNLRTVVQNGRAATARGAMMLGSLLAGLGLAGAGVGAVHAMAYPLGALFDVPHGEANAVLLPHVLEFNREACADKLARAARAMGVASSDTGDEEAAKLASRAIAELCLDVGIPPRLRDLKDVDIPREVLPEMADKAMGVARPIANNPRTVEAEDLLAIYEKIYE